MQGQDDVLLTWKTGNPGAACDTSMGNPPVGDTLVAADDPGRGIPNVAAAAAWDGEPSNRGPWMKLSKVRNTIKYEYEICRNAQ